MEPIEATVKYITRDVITSVAEYFDAVHVAGIGEAAVFKDVSLGWFMGLKNAGVLINLGHAQPPYSVGDEIEITYQKVKPNEKV